MTASAINEGQTNTLIIGYGNPGRQDDGLGPSFVQALEGRSQGLPQITLSANYQLTVEDAYDLAAYPQVIFVDASLDAKEPFEFKPVSANDAQSLGSHQVAPETVLQLCSTLYDQQPAAYVLAIRGYEFDQFEEALSSQASDNLQAALSFAEDWLKQHA